MIQQPPVSQPSSLGGNTTGSENLDDYRDFYLVGEQCIRATKFPWSFKPCTHDTSNSNYLQPQMIFGQSGNYITHVAQQRFPSAASNSNRAAEFEQTVSVDSTSWLIDFI